MVYLTRVINKTGSITAFCGINNIKTINTKHVAANSLEHTKTVFTDDFIKIYFVYTRF